MKFSNFIWAAVALWLIVSSTVLISLNSVQVVDLSTSVAIYYHLILVFAIYVLADSCRNIVVEAKKEHNGPQQ